MGNSDNAHGSSNQIDLEWHRWWCSWGWITNSRCKRKEKGKKAAKYLKHFKLITMSRIVDGVLECKAVYKYSHTWVAWQKGIDTIHLNRHYTKCTTKHEFVDRSQTQLAFGTPSTGDSSTLSTWVSSEDMTRDRMVKFIVGAELPLSIVNNKHFIVFVKKYLQPRCIGISRNTFHSDTINYFIRTK